MIPIVHITGVEKQFVYHFLDRLHNRVKHRIPITGFQVRQLDHSYNLRRELIFGLESLSNYIQDRRASANLVLAVTVSALNIKGVRHGGLLRLFPSSILAWRCPPREVSLESDKTESLQSASWQDDQVNDLVEAIDKEFLFLNAPTKSHLL